MAAKETKRTKPVTKRTAKTDAPARPRTRRLTKSLAPVDLPAPEPVAIAPEPVAIAAPVAIPEPVAITPEPVAITPEPAPFREPFAPIVRSTGGSRRALDTGAGAWVSVVYEGGATFCDDVAGVFVHGTRTRLRAQVAERLLALDGFHMP